MAGSLKHVLDNGRRYRGLSLLENSGDLMEAVEEMAFVILVTTNGRQRKKALDAYYACVRGEKPWPAWWQKPNVNGSQTIAKRWLPGETR